MKKVGIRELLRSAWHRSAGDWHRFAQRLTGDEAEAKGLVSEALYRTLRANPELETERAVDKYVRKAIQRRFFERRILRQRQRRLNERLQRRTLGLASSALRLAIDADEQRRRRRQQRLIHHHLIHLEPKLREAVELYFLREPGLTYRELAAVQRVSVATAYDRVQQALALLGKAVNEDLDE